MNEFIWDRILSIRAPIISWSLASIIDLLTITFASKLFLVITSLNNNQNIIFLSIFIIFLILIRTYLVIVLRKYACFKIFDKKNSDELKIVRKFINNRIYSNEKEEESIESFKESIMNATYAASAKFDIPVAAGIAELLFAFLGLIYLLNILGISIFIINAPLFVLLFVFSRFISKKNFQLGKLILKGIENKFVDLDNITEVSYELSALKLVDPILYSFNKSNKIYNTNEYKTFSYNFINQIVIEAFSLIIILFSLLTIVFGFLNTSLANSASVLALLSRLIPGITRCMAYYSQLQFGIAPIEKLYKVNQFQVK